MSLAVVDERPRWVVVENGPGGSRVHGSFLSPEAAHAWIWHALPVEEGLTICEVVELTPALEQYRRAA